MSHTVTKTVFEEFEAHMTRLKKASRNRRNAVECRNLVEDNEQHEALSVVEGLGKRQPQDVYDGDVNLRTLRTLLKMIDDRGWERSPHQVSPSPIHADIYQNTLLCPFIN